MLMEIHQPEVYVKNVFFQIAIFRHLSPYLLITQLLENNEQVFNLCRV
jgi:hypothetical protein